MTTTYKSFDVAETGEGTFTGYASVYDNLDYQGDVIRPGAFAKSIASRSCWPLIWNHDDTRPANIIGSVTKATENDHGLLIEAKLDLNNPTALDAYRTLKNGSVHQLSVGMVPEETSLDHEGHRTISKASLLEVSVTPTAANPAANIIEVKSITTERNTTMDETTTPDTDTQQVNVSGTVNVTPAEKTGKGIKPETKNADIERITGMIDQTPNTTGKKFMDFKSLSTAIPDAVRKTTAARGVTKGITAEGSSLIAVPLINTTPIPGDTASETTPRLIDYLPVVTRTAPVYDALVQTAMSEPGGASVVAEGAQKPTTKLQIKRVEQRLRIIATLSDPIDKYVLQDAANLDTWVGVQLTDSVRNALESEVVNGDGTGEHMTGLAHIAGAQEQAYDANLSPLDTLAAALNKLEVINVSATMIAMAPADWLTLQRLKDADGNYYMSNVLDAVTRRVWGTRVVTAASITPGTAYVIGRDALNVSTDGNVSVEWNPYTNFGTNQTVCRVEGRWQLDVFAPQRIVKTTLAKPASTGK